MSKQSAQYVQGVDGQKKVTSAAHGAQLRYPILKRSLGRFQNKLDIYQILKVSIKNWSCN